MFCYVDEVGMSSIAGPVMTAAVVANERPNIDDIKDSKKLSKKKREKVYNELINSVDFSFGFASLDKIKKMNVFWARYDAMKMSVQKLLNRGIQIDKIIVDGKFVIPDLSIPQEAVIKADDKFWQASAASILAKVRRDSLMSKLSKLEQYSYYDWDQNAGYFSPKHQIGIILFGPTSLHRLNFSLLQKSINLFEKHQEFLDQGGSSQEFFNSIVDSKKKKQLSDYIVWENGNFKGWK